MLGPIRVLLVEPSTLLRRSLAIALGHRRRIRMVGEAATGSEALAVAASAQPDVIVLDPEVEDGGMKLVRDLARIREECAVLILARTTRATPVQPTLEAGARGYLEKDCDPPALIEALERVHRGDLVVGPRVRESLVHGLRNGRHQAGPLGLTAREIEVLQLVAHGYSNRKIAGELVITEHTVKAHLAKIREKLGVESRVQLASYAA